MDIVEAFKMSLKSILNNKLRTFLTMLGVIIGVASVITAVGFAKGSTKSITDNLESIGTNLITVSLLGRNISNNVTYDLVEEKVRSIDGVSGIAPQVTSSITIKNSTNTNKDTSLIGTSDEYSSVKDVNVQEGRFLTSFDIVGNMKVAIIGTAVSNDLFPNTSAVGEYVKFNNQTFKIVGVLKQTARWRGFKRR